MIKYTYPSYGVAYNNPKLAALFFDKIFSPQAQEVPNDILIPDPLSQWQRKDLFKTFMMILTQENAKKVGTDNPINLLSDVYALFTSFALNETGRESVPIFSTTLFSNYGAESIEISNAIQISINNIPQIDESTLSWEKILEIRSDPDAINKLRRFRLLIYSEFKDKSKQYIEDTLLVKLEDYNNICKKHGLDVFLTSTSNILNSKSLLAATSIAAIGVLMGNDILIDTSLVVGASVEIGKIVIDLSKKNINHNISVSQEEIGYIPYLKNVLKSD